MQQLLFISILLLFFIYVGYGLAIAVYNRLSFFRKKKSAITEKELPTVAVVIAAYNEEAVIEEKIKNTLGLVYPDGKLKVYVIADGCTDKTTEIVSNYPDVVLLHQSERKGKSAAINRAMKFVKEEVTVFTDANVNISKDGLLFLCGVYVDECVGGVSGEKVVMSDERAAAASTEGLYWKYESFLKREDARLSSLIGAAGELFSLRTHLFTEIPDDTLLDDFAISINIMRKGYRLEYAPKAFAMESPSSGIKEEYKRKVRIATGGLQTISRSLDLFNPFNYGIVSLQYLIHRVSRWTISPILLIVAFVSNYIVRNDSLLCSVLFALQLCFYTAGMAGWYFKERNKQYRLLNVPFYFLFMHYCVLIGWIKYFGKKQEAAWQKAVRIT